jgi:hypothetical protein
MELELRAAGLRDVEARGVSSIVRLASAAECLRFEREAFGALHQMLVGLPVAERNEAWAEVGTALRQFEGQGGIARCVVFMPCLLRAVRTRSSTEHGGSPVAPAPAGERRKRKYKRRVLRHRGGAC